MEDLQRLRARRRTHRSPVSKLFKRSEELLDKNQFGPADKAAIDGIIETLQRKNEVLAALEENIQANGKNKIAQVNITHNNKFKWRTWRLILPQVTAVRTLTKDNH